VPFQEEFMSLSKEDAGQSGENATSHSSYHDTDETHEAHAHETHETHETYEPLDQWEPVGGGSDVFPLLPRKPRLMSEMDHE
jgi:hypothetical protein